MINKIEKTKELLERFYIDTQGADCYAVEDAKFEIATEIVKLFAISDVNTRFPEKEELENEVKMYATSIISETTYIGSRIHLEYAFKAGINYLNDFLNGR